MDSLQVEVGSLVLHIAQFVQILRFLSLIDLSLSKAEQELT